MTESINVFTIINKFDRLRAIFYTRTVFALTNFEKGCKSQDIVSKMNSTRFSGNLDEFLLQKKHFEIAGNYRQMHKNSSNMILMGILKRY